jgi:multicomponent Na+:H+ antiporter subunit G
VTALDVASGVLLLAGSAFAVTGGVGLLRFPDFYTRTHAAGLTDSAGATLILLGLLLQAPDLASAVRLVLIMIFLLITGPTATHALAHAARNDGVRVWAEREDKKR